jgi:hypothetical protein
MRLKKPEPGHDIDESWFPEFFDYVTKRLIKGDGITTSVKLVDNTYFVSAKPSKSAGSASDSEYQGHFRIINSTSSAQQVTIIDGIDADAANCGQVVAGLTTINVPKATLAITAKSWICLKLTYTTAYVAELVALAAAPVQASGKYYRVLGIVTWEAAAIKAIQQIHYGDIHVAGRAV